MEPKDWDKLDKQALAVWMLVIVGFAVAHGLAAMESGIF